jgi:hypothetical protein
MNTYKIVLTYGTFFVRADYYSLINGNYQFWMGRRIVVSYPESDVVNVGVAIE